jgi:hypothetical protein
VNQVAAIRAAVHAVAAATGYFEAGCSYIAVVELDGKLQTGNSVQ